MHDDQQPQPRQERKPWPIILVWLAVTLPILLVQLSRRDGETYRITYTEFNGQIKADNIASAEVNPQHREVRGEFRRPVVYDGRQRERFRTTLPLDDPAPVVALLEANDVAIEAKAPGARWTTVILSMLPWIFLIGFWILLLRRMQSTPQQAMMFGRSGAKPLSPDTPRTTFADVAGADEAKAELQELIDFLRDPAKFQRLGGRLPKGVLLVGPPGTGKTLLARAVAGEAGRPFFSMSGSDFVEMFVGVGAARIRDLFAQGRSHAPCIIFIDELDAVGRQRGAGLGGGHDEREQTLNQLLVELDGFDTKEGVILLSATNRPDVLDPALLRPGRFDRQIVVDLPDVAAREKILTVHARKIPLHDRVDLAVIARGTPGLSGADLENIANEAALLAARRDKDRVDMTDFEDAKDKVMLGVERKSMILTDEDKRVLAYHESGHALVSVLIPNLDPVHKVTIVPRGQALGVTFALPEIDRRNLTREYLLGKITAAYGGRAAEEVVFGLEHITTGAAQDYRQATEMARRMVTEFGMSDELGPISVAGGEEEVFLGRELVRRREVSDHTAEIIDREVDRVARAAYARARDIIETNIEALHALAHALVDLETLDRRQVEELVRGAARHPRPAPPSAQPATA